MGFSGECIWIYPCLLMCFRSLLCTLYPCPTLSPLLYWWRRFVSIRVYRKQAVYQTYPWETISIFRCQTVPVFIFWCWCIFEHNMIQGFSQRMRLQRRLYRTYSSVLFLTLRVPCSFKLFGLSLPNNFVHIQNIEFQREPQVQPSEHRNQKSLLLCE